jgi:MoaA/NifB/PqqE/SkfB family radical SAM enzyme
MCNIHSNEWKDKMTTGDFNHLLSRSEFKDLLEVSITGGEPFLRHDLSAIVQGMIESLPKLKWVFINTNGTYPESVKEFLTEFSTSIKKLTVSISIEGDRNVHERIRGIKNFDLAIKTLGLASNSGFPNVSAIISTTLTSLNADARQLEFIRRLAEEYKCGYTFRFADSSSTYYRNERLAENLAVSKKQKEEIIEFISRYLKDDPFQQIQKRFLETGTTGLKCTAGKDFAFVQADGKIYPCIFSTRVIGDKDSTIETNISDLGKFEPCPCCTECTVYPSLNYGLGSARA